MQLISMAGRRVVGKERNNLKTFGLLFIFEVNFASKKKKTVHWQ